MDTILIGRPSVVASNWKSTAHTLFGASAARTLVVVLVPRRVSPNPQALLPSQPLDLLVVDRPALGAGVMVVQRVVAHESTHDRPKALRTDPTVVAGSEAAAAGLVRLRSVMWPVSALKAARARR
jgi:hypothetical protein